MQPNKIFIIFLLRLGNFSNVVGSLTAAGAPGTPHTIHLRRTHQPRRHRRWLLGYRIPMVKSRRGAPDAFDPKEENITFRYFIMDLIYMNF